MMKENGFKANVGFGRILEAIPEFVIVVDRGGIILYVNRVEPGYDRNQVIGMTAASLILPDALHTFVTALDSVFDTGVMAEYDIVIPSLDGIPQWYRSRMLPLREDDRTGRLSRPCSWPPTSPS